MSKVHIFVALLTVVLAATSVFADEKAIKSGRSSKLEFDDEVVEGMRKGQGDFGALATKRKRKKNTALYNKNVIFQKEMAETLKEIRYEQ